MLTGSDAGEILQEPEIGVRCHRNTYNYHNCRAKHITNYRLHEKKYIIYMSNREIKTGPKGKSHPINLGMAKRVEAAFGSCKMN